MIIALVTFLALGTRSFQPNLMSKLNTIVQVVTAAAVLASGVWPRLIPGVSWLPYAAGASTLASGVSYVLERVLRADPATPAAPPPEG